MNDRATSSGNLDGLIAVVTGAAQGLGLGIAEQLARDGATAIIADLQRDKGRLKPHGCRQMACMCRQPTWTSRTAPVSRHSLMR